MSLILRVIMLSEVNCLIEFEQKKLRDTIPDESDRMFAGWSARWRQEALEHYIKTGWSFIAIESGPPGSHPEGEVLGYFMAQPLLFLDGQTQALWVEHLQFSTLLVRDTLCDLAIRMARDKHFQRVYFSDISTYQQVLGTMKAQDWNPQVMFVKTTKAQ